MEAASASPNKNPNIPEIPPPEVMLADLLVYATRLIYVLYLMSLAQYSYNYIACKELFEPDIQFRLKVLLILGWSLYIFYAIYMKIFKDKIRKRIREKRKEDDTNER